MLFSFTYRERKTNLDYFFNFIFLGVQVPLDASCSFQKLCWSRCCAWGFSQEKASVGSQDPDLERQQMAQTGDKTFLNSKMKQLFQLEARAAG